MLSARTDKQTCKPGRRQCPVAFALHMLSLQHGVTHALSSCTCATSKCMKHTRSYLTRMYNCMCRPAERERVSCTNFASTMVTLLVSNPLLPQLDLSCLRIASCGGSPLPPATVRRAIAAFGCPFFISYGMTECCGKISMSLLPKDCSNFRYVHVLFGCHWPN